MRKKKILFITTGTEITASSRTRVYNYRPFFEARDFMVKIIPYNTQIDSRLNVHNEKRNAAIKIANKINHFFRCIFYLWKAPLYDIIFIQRVLLPNVIFAAIKAMGKRIVFDFDDAIYMSAEDGQVPPHSEKFSRRFRHILMNVDCVIASTSQLGKVASTFNKHVTVIPTPVNTDRLKPRTGEDLKKEVVIGWIGSPETVRLVYELEPALTALTKKYPFVGIELVGSLPSSKSVPWARRKEWSIDTESADLQNFDIGIMSLPDDEWYRGKGGYKLLQYMAVGIPSVASAVGVSKELIKEGVNGFLVASKDAWIDKLSMLIENPELRKKIGNAARRMAEGSYSYKINSSKLIGAVCP